MMFMNARPQSVSNRFETFVITRRTEPVHQRLVEMTNNKINAGGNFWPVAAPVSDSWDYILDDFHGNENSPLQTQHSEYLQTAIPAYSQTPGINYEKVSASHSQHQTQTKSFASQQRYEPESNRNYIFEHNSMLGNGSSWSFKHQNGSFPDFTDGRNSTNFMNYKTGPDFNLHASTSNLAPAQSYCQDNTPGKSPLLKFESLRNSATQIDCLSSNTYASPSSLAYSAILKENTPSKDAWYSEISDISNDQFQDHYGLAQFHDDLPRGRIREEHFQTRQDYGDMWNINYEEDGTWASEPHPASSETISPKVLTLNFPSAPVSSCGSSNDHKLSLSDLSTVASSEDDDLSAHEKLMLEKPVPFRPRQNIPNSISISQRIVPVLAGNDHNITGTSSENRQLDTESNTQQTKAATSRNNEKRHPPVTQPSRSMVAHKRIEPKPVDPLTQQSFAKAPHTAKMTHQRDAKDTFLVQSKLAGMSYKDIRKQGGFTEAESTLRGRFRTLTKAKSARVRKPEWSNNDIRLLKKAVRRLTTAADYAQSRVPWKQVAEYIANNGGSYHFGNATCRKKWDELNEDGDQ